MDDILIEAGSTTSAMRLARMLERKANFSAAVVHTPATLATGGCSYSVRTRRAAAEHAMRLAQNHGLTIKKIYEIQIKDGERVYNALS